MNGEVDDVANPLMLALSFVFIITFVYIAMRAINAANAEPGRRRRRRRSRRHHSMTRNDEELYREAAKIIAYLTHIREIDGEFSSDVILSDKTRARLDQWLARYRREIES